MKKEYCDCSKTGKEAFWIDMECWTCNKAVNPKEMEEELKAEKLYFDSLKNKSNRRKIR